jgi:putative transposase
MKALYEMIGITKQAHYKRINHQKVMIERSSHLLEEAAQLRVEHKRMGCRKLYHEIKPEGLGRDRAEEILLNSGFRVKRKRNRCRTTYAGKNWYPNRISGIEVRDINQVWVSDITYLPVSYRKFYYLTLIQDVYSRKVVGWSLSLTMRSFQTVVPACLMAIKDQSINRSQNLIIHSDKGSQYYWAGLAQLYQKYGIIPSMGGKAWENAHAESINGVLKNEYIDIEGLSISFNKVKKVVTSAIEKYNHKRPHGSLNNMKPVEFEHHIKSLTNKNKPVMKINY